MSTTGTTDMGVALLKRSVILLAVALAVTSAVVTLLLLTGVTRWEEVVGFVEWLSGATAFGAIIAGVLALTAAWLAYHGVQQTIHSTEQREERTRQAVDTRERERARHDRFAAIVTQLSSPQATVRLGGLISLGALADEWEREARRLIGESRSAHSTQLWSESQENWERALAQLEAIRGVVATLPYSPARKTKSPGVVAAEQRLSTVRWSYMLVHDRVPLSAKDAVSQRDSCLDLVATYVGESLWLDPPTGSDDSTLDAPKGPHIMRRQDKFTSAAAFALIHEHIKVDAAYPWPPQQLNLSWLQVGGYDLTAVHLEGVIARDIDLNAARLPRAHLEDAILKSAHLQSAVLVDAHLERSDLNGADLSYAELMGAHLKGASLYGTQLREANLAGAHLEGVSLTWAFLGAEDSDDLVILADVSEDGQPRRVHWDPGTTKWPYGFDPDAVADRQLEAAQVRWSLKLDPAGGSSDEVAKGPGASPTTTGQSTVDQPVAWVKRWRGRRNLAQSDDQEHLELIRQLVAFVRKKYRGMLDRFAQ